MSLMSSHGVACAAGGLAATDAFESDASTQRRDRAASTLAAARPILAWISMVRGVFE
jgi:hypothetical protein